MTHIYRTEIIIWYTELRKVLNNILLPEKMWKELRKR